MSTFASIELGKRSLAAHNQSVQTAGHNIANSSTKGYTRQRVNLDSFEPLYRPDLTRSQTAGQIGQGVMVSSITRLRDELLDARIIGQSDDAGFWQTRSNYLQLLEQVYNEPEDISVRARMDQFWESWQELSMYPSSTAARKAVLTRSQTLTDAIHHQFNSLQGIRSMANGDIEATVKQVNDILGKIAALNEQIVKSKAMGDNPNDLMDKRDVFAEELAGLIPISVDKHDEDEHYVIHTGGLEVVQGKSFKPLSVVSGVENEGYSVVVWADSGEKANFSGGKLGALLGLRDGDIREAVQNLDTVTMNFVDLVNDIHRGAMGLNGSTNVNFFAEQYFINNVDGNFDRSGNGVYDSSYIFRITGANTLNPREQIGLEGQITLSSQDGVKTVPYYPTDMVSDVVERINRSNAEVVAYLDQDNKLVLKASTAHDPENPDFVIRQIDDSGRFLAGYAGFLKESGANAGFTWNEPNAVNRLAEGVQYAVAPIAHPSGWMALNPAITHDVQNIATGYATVEGLPYAGDNRAALAIAALRNSPVMIGDVRTFDDYFADTVTHIGLKGEQAERSLATQNAILTDLSNVRESISGVNIDEELSDILRFQHGYNASARFIVAVNEMLDTLINKV